MNETSNSQSEQARQLRSNPPQNLSIKEAAIYVGVSVRTLWGHATKGRVKAARVGKRLIFKKSELDRWLDVLMAQSA